MSFTQENMVELDVLMLFDLSTSMEGIKIHKSADLAKTLAARSLYEKGFITQVDGGYLTDLGRKAAEHVQQLYTMLNAHSAQ